MEYSIEKLKMKYSGIPAEGYKKLSVHPSRGARNFVMECTLHIERSVTDFLAMRLNIDVNNSKALGRSNGALSFNQKIQLLEDIKILPDIARNKLNILMEVRNKFAHDYQCNSFKSCFDSLKGRRKFLEKNYGNEIKKLKESEERDEKLFCCLYDDILQIAANIFSEVLNYFDEEAQVEAKLLIVDSIREEIELITDPNLVKIFQAFLKRVEKRFKYKKSFFENYPT